MAQDVTAQRAKELAQLLKRDGVLLPEAVVERASDPNSAMHDWFEWDDTEAAKAHRIWQARELIRVQVTMLPNSDTTTRVYVSLPRDRAGSGGYRSVVEVMSDEAMAAEMLQAALDDADRWRTKYRNVRALVPVFTALDSVKPIQRKKKVG